MGMGRLSAGNSSLVLTDTFNSLSMISTVSFASLTAEYDLAVYFLIPRITP